MSDISSKAGEQPEVEGQQLRVSVERSELEEALRAGEGPVTLWVDRRQVEAALQSDDPEVEGHRIVWSDARLKRTIASVPSALEALSAIRTDPR